LVKNNIYLQKTVQNSVCIYNKKKERTVLCSYLN
jgi:hypothetical protein